MKNVCRPQKPIPSCQHLKFWADDSWQLMTDIQLRGLELTRPGSYYVSPRGGLLRNWSQLNEQHLGLRYMTESVICSCSVGIARMSAVRSPNLVYHWLYCPQWAPKCLSSRRVIHPYAANCGEKRPPGLQSKPGGAWCPMGPFFYLLRRSGRPFGPSSHSHTVTGGGAPLPQWQCENVMINKKKQQKKQQKLAKTKFFKSIFGPLPNMVDWKFFLLERILSKVSKNGVRKHYT